MYMTFVIYVFLIHVLDLYEEQPLAEWVNPTHEW